MGNILVGLLWGIYSLATPSLKTLHNIPVIAPAGALSKQDMAKLERDFPTLETRSSSPPAYWHSASDAIRSTELLGVLNTPGIWVWCLRGGYGSARLIPYLEKNGARPQKKIFIGYSDITCLHLWASHHNGKGLHGSMPGDWLKPSVKRKNFSLLNDVLQTKQGMLEYSGLQPLNGAAQEARCLKGAVIGGNLTLLVHSIGTSWQLNSREKILIIEDIHLTGYQVDRALFHLKQSGVIKGATAIIFGDFVGPYIDVQRALKRFAAETAVPVFYWPHFGHGADNFPIPLGFPSTLQNIQRGWTWTISYDF